MKLYQIVTIAFVLLYFCACVNHKTKSQKRGEAREALEFFGESYAFPNQNTPDSAYGLAWDFIQRNYPNTSAPDFNNWESLGPNNVGGRTICIAIHPTDTNIVFLGSASGGLWKSTTGGHGLNAWQYVETGFPVLGVSSIAINPSNPAEMYIGTGETYDYGTSLNGLVVRTTRGSHGIGILKTTDGGATWTKSLDYAYAGQRTVWDILYHPAMPDILYAATTEGVLKTQNGGVTWETVLAEKMVMDLAMDPSDFSVLYAGVGNLSSTSRGLYQTKDGGNTWNKLTNGLPSGTFTGRISVAISASNPNIVYANFTQALVGAGLYRSENKGNTWSLVTTQDLTTYQGWFSKCLFVKPNDPNEVFAGGAYLWTTTDGQNFTQITDYEQLQIETRPWPDMHDLIANPKDPNKLYLLTDAGLYKSNDGGSEWAWCAHGYNVSQFYTGSVSAQNPELIIGGLQDRNSQLHIGLNDWTVVGGGDGTFNAIDPTDDQVQYIASQNLYIGSNQQGIIFSGISPAFVAPFLLAPSDPEVIYAGDIHLNVSFDRGATWAQSVQVDGGNPILAMDVSRQSSGKVYFATAPRAQPQMQVFVTENAGSVIFNISNGLPNRYPRDIAVHPTNDAIAYIVFSGFGTPHVYKTTDSGTSWTNVSTTLPDAPFHTVLVNPENGNQVWVGCDYGVFESLNGGTTWQLLNQYMPPAVMVFELEYSPADKSLLAFTHGHGLYRRKIGTPTDVKNLAPTAFDMMVYPSIPTDRIHIRIQTASRAARKLKIIDVQGKVVLEKPLDASEETMHSLPDGLISGTYFVQVQLGEQVVTKRILKI
jgi:photosystem II stability/assembly factor-like uncharacterized protein